MLKGRKKEIKKRSIGGGHVFGGWVQVSKLKIEITSQQTIYKLNKKMFLIMSAPSVYYYKYRNYCNQTELPVSSLEFYPFKSSQLDPIAKSYRNQGKQGPTNN